MMQQLRLSRAKSTLSFQPQPQAYVFDKDGTLLDAHLTWAPAFRVACAAMPHSDELLFDLLGFDSSSATFTNGSSYMMDPTDVIKAHLQRHGIDGDLFFNHMDAQTIISMPVMNTAQLFEAVRAQGAKVAILTSDDRRNTEIFLEQQNVAVDAVVCGDDGRGQKPSADPLQSIAADLGLPVESLVMVGDSAHDIDCGKAAGSHTIGVLTGVGQPSTIAHSDLVLDSVVDIFRLVSKHT